MAGLDKLTAGQLSEAAYIPKDTFAAPGGVPAGAVPDGWRADTALSVARGNNQFIVFVNDATRQAVITFKGTDSLSQLKSDLLDDAASQWATLKNALADNISDIRTKYAGYELMTDGTSSGGGMSQTAALKYNLTGYGQNSLPIGWETIEADPQLNNGQLAGAIDNWRTAGNKFYEVNEVGDIATGTYSGKVFLYTNETTTILSGSYAKCMDIFYDSNSPEAALSGFSGAFWCSYTVHRIETVNQDLKLEQQGALLNDPEMVQRINANAGAIAEKLATASPIENLDGSMMFGADNIVVVSPAPGIVQIIKDDVLRMQAQVLADSNALLKYYDSKNTHPYTELDVTKGPDGKITAAQVTLDPNVLAAGMSIGQIFGSALGGALGGNSLAGNLASSTIGGLIGQKFVQVLATSMTADLSSISLNDVFAGQGIGVANAGIGAISSFLTAELGHALHIDGFDGQLFNTAVSGFTTSLLSQVTDKMARGSLDFAGAVAAMDWSQAVTGAIDVAQINLGNLLGGYLGHELVPAQTREGAIGGQLFGAIGGFILPGGLGSLIGTIIGTLIFNHFGTQPSPGAVDLLDQAGYFYGHSQYQSSDGGGYGVSDTMAQAADDIVNAYLHAVDGAALDHGKQVALGYIKNPDLLFITGAPGNTNHSFTSADDAVHAAALDVLQNLEVIGGDLLMKRAHQNSPSNIPEAGPAGGGAPGLSQVSGADQLATLAGDLSVAQDYENYLDNREAINALIAANVIMGGSRDSCRSELFA